MTTLVKIDKATVRDNPDYGCGNSAFHIPTSHVTLSIDGGLPYPVPHADVDAVIKANSGRSISIIQEMIDVTCKDNYAPKYLYKYENTPVPCNECGKETGYHDFETETFINEDGDEFDHDRCPHCGGVESFSYELESL